MCFKDVGRITDSDRDDRTFGFCCDLEASFMEWKHIKLILISVSGTFREDTDGNAGFDLVDGCEDGLESLFDILTVKKQTVKIFHPVGKKRITLHFFLGNVAGTDRTAAVSKHDVKITSVIANVENRSILGNIFFADDRNFGSGFPENEFKYFLDNSKRTDFLGPW